MHSAKKQKTISTNLYKYEGEENESSWFIPIQHLEQRVIFV